MLIPAQLNNFDVIRLKLASPDDIHGWSHGEVTKPETINYRTQKPEKDGLFCERIFGPSKDWECYCGKYKKIRYKGIVCDKCGVEVTRSVVRRERMGHIDLAIPVSHIWFLRGVPSKIGLLLDLSVQNLEKVIYFADFIISRVDNKLKIQKIEELKQEYRIKQKEIENSFKQKSQNLQNVTAGQGLVQEIEALDVAKSKELADLKAIFDESEEELESLREMNIITENKYQELSLKYGSMFEAGIGAEAIRELLLEINMGKLIVELNQELTTASGAKKDRLIKRIKLLKSLDKNNIRPEWTVMTTVPVIPPDLRPMVSLDGGRFATSDLNDLYRRVINRNNRLKRLLELNAPEVICRNEKRMLQEAVDALIDNSARHSKTVVASTGQKRELKSISDYLKGKQGRFRQNLLGKRIDYSGRSVIVVGPQLKINQCGLPKLMALELFKPFIISRLIKENYVHNIRSANRFIESNRSEVWDILEEVVKGSYVMLNRAPTLHRLGIQAFQPVLIEGKAIHLHPLVCSPFNADFDGDQMAVHVPLTEEAKNEAREIMASHRNLLKPSTGAPSTTPSQDIVLGCYYLTRLDDNVVNKIFTSPDEAKLAYNLEQLGLHTKIKVRMWDKITNKVGLVETSVGRLFFMEILPEKIEYPHRTMDSKSLSALVRLSLEYHGFQETAEFLDRLKELGYKFVTKSGYSWGMKILPLLAEKKGIVKEGDVQVAEIHEQYEMGLLTDGERHNKIIEIWTHVKDRISTLSKASLDKNSTVFAMMESGARGSWAQLAQMVGMKGLVSSPSGDIIELPAKGNFKEGFDVLEYFISTHGTRKGLSDTALRTASAGYLTRRLVDVVQDVVVHTDDCGEKEGIAITAAESKEMDRTLIERVVGRFAADNIVNPKTGAVVIKKGELITEELGRQLSTMEGLTEIRVRSPLVCRLKRGICQKCYGYNLAYNDLVNIGVAVGIMAAQSIGEPGTQLTMRTFHTGGVAGADITQGLPRVEELFEARSPKRKAFMADFDGQIKIEESQRVITDASGKTLMKVPFGQKIARLHYNQVEEDDYTFKSATVKNKAVDGEVKVKGEKAPKLTIKVLVADGATVGKGDTLFTYGENRVVAKRAGIVKLEKTRVKLIVEADKIMEYIIPPGYSIVVKDGDFVNHGDALTTGSLDLQQLYKNKGKEAVQKYILKEIQHIYTTQAGQKLNDKHLEVILRQMFSRVYVRDAGDTDLLPGEIMEKAEAERVNEEAEASGKNPAKLDELFLGISKVALSTSSFLSAASFQETAKVLINAAVTGRVDRLEGLKENVIIGRLIPAGTGYGIKHEDYEEEVPAEQPAIVELILPVEEK